MKRRSPEAPENAQRDTGRGARPDEDTGFASLAEEVQALKAEVKRFQATAEKSNLEMQAFAYSVSHDLRAPVRAIEGFSKIILEDFGHDIPQEAQKFLKHIISNTQQLSSQIEDLLRFYRLGKSPPHKTRVKSESIAREALNELSSETPPVEFVALDETLADPSHLRQIFTELLANAVKATRNNPTLPIQIGSKTQNGFTTFYVRDQGIGFDLQHAGKLFQVFQKLHSVTEFAGNGIGLALVKRMVDAHGGRVWVESEPEKGATFYFSLPDEG